MKQDIFRDLPAIDPDWNIGIVASTYHGGIIDRLVAGAAAVLTEAGINKENIHLHRAPGSFELPLIGAALVQKGEVDALMGFGIILQGETHHARLLADAVTKGMMDIQVRYAMPFAFEMLYVDRIEQAEERSTGLQNKGREAAYAVLHSLAELRMIRGRR